MLKRLLAHPLTRGLDIDAPETTLLRRRIIQEKAFLKAIYLEWYAWLAAALRPTGSAAPTGGDYRPVLELGSGGGFLRQALPGLLTSEIFHLDGLDLALDGRALPFRDGGLGGIVMTNVFHHIPQPAAFLGEASRCLAPGACLAMVEPWVSAWSRQVYRRLHHEPFEPEMPGWDFPASGPLSGANGALPWIVFERDRRRFESQFPELSLRSVSPGMPFCYLLSGGVSMRSLLPGWSYGGVRGLEKLLRPWNRQLGMFACIVVQKRGLSSRKGAA